MQKAETLASRIVCSFALQKRLERAQACRRSIGCDEATFVTSFGRAPRCGERESGETNQRGEKTAVDFRFSRSPLRRQRRRRQSATIGDSGDRLIFTRGGGENRVRSTLARWRSLLERANFRQSAPSLQTCARSAATTKANGLRCQNAATSNRSSVDPCCAVCK